MAFRFAIVLLCAGLTAFAQTSKRPASRKPAAPSTGKAAAEKPAVPAMQAWPIGELKVEGNKLYADDKILAVAGLKVGQMAGKAEFDAARDRLLASGAFESVGYKFDPLPGQRANVGVFQVSEITQLFPLRFEELRVDEKALREHLKSTEPLFTDKIPATKPVLDRFTRSVQEFAKNPDIVSRMDATGELSVVFRPGSLPAVAEITFAGNKVIPTAKLQQLISGAGIGALYTENRFRNILDVGVRPAYEALGYLRVQFPKLEISPAREVKGIAIKVHVDEGAIYKLAEVQVTGELEENSKELLKTGGFVAGDVANFDKVRAGIDEIRKALRRKGYIDVKLTSDRKLDDEKKTVTVTLKIDPGPQFTMGQLTIDGLDIETEPHIRKMWTLKRGQPFNVEYPDYFLERLIADQIMDNLGKATSSIEPNHDRKTVDVTLKLAGEKRPAKPALP